MISLLTRSKGFLTDKGFETTVNAQQTLGGSGFTRENGGWRQFVRDARIAMIYEDTKRHPVARPRWGASCRLNGGKTVMAFFEMVKGFIKENEGDATLSPGLPRSAQGCIEGTCRRLRCISWPRG